MLVDWIERKENLLKVWLSTRNYLPMKTLKQSYAQTPIQINNQGSHV